MFSVGASEAKSPHAGLYIGEKQASANDEARRFQANLAETSAVAGRCGQFAVTILERLRVEDGSRMKATNSATSIPNFLRADGPFIPHHQGKFSAKSLWYPPRFFDERGEPPARWPID